MKYVCNVKSVDELKQVVAEAEERKNKAEAEARRATAELYKAQAYENMLYCAEASLDDNTFANEIRKLSMEELTLLGHVIATEYRSLRDKYKAQFDTERQKAIQMAAKKKAEAEAKRQAREERIRLASEKRKATLEAKKAQKATHVTSTNGTVDQTVEHRDPFS